MPELPEVETICRGLAPAMEGRVVVQVEARRPDLRIPLPRDLAERVAGRRIEKVSRRAKFLLIELDSGEVLVVHLGMSGRLDLETGSRRKPERHDHVAFVLAGGTSVTLNDPRRFGLVTLIAKNAIARHPLFAALGPEPLSDGFGGASLAAALQGRKTSIKAALLDQRRIAGLGNIYACEALFYAGISPQRRAGTVKGEKADALARAVKLVLERAIEVGGSSVRDYVQPSGELGYFQHQWAVYDKEGRACPGCDCRVEKTGGVRRMVQGGRSTFYCPRRQR